MNKFFKVFSWILTLTLVFTVFAPMGNAQEKDVIEGYDEAEFLELMNFVKSTIEVDELGNAKVNLEKIENELGYIPQDYIDFNNSDKNINVCTQQNTTLNSLKRVSTYSYSSPYNDCIVNEIKIAWKDITGVASLTAAIEALAAGKELEAAKHIIKAGAKGGIHGIVLSLGWIQIKCIGA
ncbi:hypothetical protein AAGS61_20700 [Lysinibacillus sp. KU-BSD001]|uniref:hypothetical protein n=1 Tax=Lysinibacillus sp. KU-BSD001 TaxID=3141328 RepID=UPI0036F04C3E